MTHPKYTVGDSIIVMASWGNPETPQTADQYFMGVVEYAFIQNDEWMYHIETSIMRGDFPESKIL